MTSTTLPPTFLLYIPSRDKGGNTISCFVLLNTITPPSGVQEVSWTKHWYSTDYDITLERAWGLSQNVGTATVMSAPKEGHAPIPLAVRVQNYSTNGAIKARFTTSGAAVPVLGFMGEKHKQMFNNIIKTNINITINTNPSTAPVSAPVPVPTPAPAPVSAPVPAPAPKTNKAKAAGTLHPFVAKQLVDLAIIRKEMCPITVEEFARGHSAVMPCGHIFMQFAIEETFKKEPNKCPACRQPGIPTYA
jgi:hypothetical protein